MSEPAKVVIEDANVRYHPIAGPHVINPSRFHVNASLGIWRDPQKLVVFAAVINGAMNNSKPPNIPNMYAYLSMRIPVFPGNRVNISVSIDNASPAKASGAVVVSIEANSDLWSMLEVTLSLKGVVAILEDVPPELAITVFFTSV